MKHKAKILNRRLKMFSDCKDIMTVKEAAKALRIGCETMYRLVHEGKIKSVWIGHRVFIPKIYLIDFVMNAQNTDKNLVAGNLTEERSVP